MALACLRAVSRCLPAAAADPGGRERLLASAQTSLRAEPRERADLLAAEAFLDTPEGAFSPGEKCQLQELLRAKQAGEKDRRRQSQDYTRLHFYLTAEHWARLSGRLSLREKAEYILETATTVLQLCLPTEQTLAGVTAICSLLEGGPSSSWQLATSYQVVKWCIRTSRILRSTNTQAALPAMSGPVPCGLRICKFKMGSRMPGGRSHEHRLPTAWRMTAPMTSAGHP